MPSCNTSCLTWVSLTADVGYLFTAAHGCPSKVQPLLPTSEEGYLLTAAPPDLECGVAPLSPPAPAAAAPWRWVAPLGHRPWPRAWQLPSAAPPALWPPGHLGGYPWPWARGGLSRPCFCAVRRSRCASAVQSKLFNLFVPLFSQNKMEFHAKVQL